MNLWSRHAAPEAAYVGTNFDVEVVYVTETGSTPNRPTSLINNVANFNDQSANFSQGSEARIAYCTYDTTVAGGQVKLNIVNIDGVTAVNTSGGILFQNGRVTAVVDEGDNLSGSVEIKVVKPTSAPSNSTPESIALTGNAREFFPHGHTFDDSITVILYYDAADLTAASITDGTAGEYSLKVYWYNSTVGRWEDYHAVVDPTNRNGALGSLTFQTNHFSTFGVGLEVGNKPSEPALISPADGSTISSLSQVFTWQHYDTTARPQTSFRLQIAPDTGFSSTMADVIRDQAETSTSVTLPIGDSALWWRVQTAASGRAFGSWSGYRAFTTAIHPPDAPALVAPAANSDTTVFTPLFAWQHVDRDTDPQSRFQFTIATDSSFVNEVHSIATESTASSTQVPGGLAAGSYYWRVRTADLTGYGAWSAIRSLRVSSQGLSPLLQPATDTLTHLAPTFRWTHQNQSSMPQTAYKLEIDDDPLFASPSTVMTSSSADSAVTLSGDNILAVRGTMRLYWRVRTAVSGTDFGPAADSSFMASLNAPAAPALLTPANGTETAASSLTFSWTHSDPEGNPQTGYALRIARDTTFSNPIYSEAASSSSASKTLAMSLSGGTYYWTVATRDAVDLGSFAAARSFSVDTRSQTPLLNDPSPGFLATSPAISFGWTHRDVGGQPQSSAQIDISLDSSFGSIWKSRTITGNTQGSDFTGTDSLFLVGESTVYWRVRTASFGTDYGAFSSTSSFVIRMNLPQSPVLTSPVSRSVTRSPELVLHWQHRDSAPQQRFELQVARDSAFTSPTLVSGAAEEEALFAPNDWTTRYWRVRTANAAGWSSYSDSLSFNHPFWRVASRTSTPKIPAGETVTLTLQLLTETGVPTEWVPGVRFTLGSVTLASEDFSSDATTGSIAVRIDTAGVYRIRASQEDISSESATLYVIVRPATGDTYVIASGRNGVGQRVMDDDTSVTVILRVPNPDSSLRLRIATSCDTLILGPSAPTSFDTNFARWDNVSVALSGGGRICFHVMRGADTVSSVEAMVFVRPAVAGRFRESDTAEQSIVVEVPANASDTPIFVFVRRNVSDSAHENATRDARTKGRKLVESSVVEITAEDIDGRLIENFRNNLTLKMPSSGGQRLRIAYLKNGAWVEVDETNFDSALQEASAGTDHLSVWGLTVAAAGSGSVQSVRIYPNPWRADGPTANLATSNPAHGLKFDQMPSGTVRIRVYTIAGEIVLDGSLDPASLGATAANGHLQVVDVGGATGQVTRWDLANQNGQTVASGVYIIVMEGPGGKATRKFAVIR